MIANPGNIYSSYDSWAREVKAKKWKSLARCPYEKLKYRVGKIKAIHPHLSEKEPRDLLFLIDIGDMEIIIGQAGIELAPENSKDKTSLIILSVINELKGNQ